MDNKKFWSTLEQTNWYEFIHLILKFSYEIVVSLSKNCSVLIHCSDGWDRSSQLLSTAQILIDPYFRTIKGLIVLIEKEWLSFGHQFALRNGIYVKEPNEDQRSPIFLQWLDCVHQLLRQFPNAFEFNMELLLFLADHLNSNLYGTFMYNSEYERQEREAKTKTLSIWTDVLENVEAFRNPFYEDGKVKVLHPNYAPYSLRFWEELFLKFNNYIDNQTLYIDQVDNILVESREKFFEHLQLNHVEEVEMYKGRIEDMNRKMSEIRKLLNDTRFTEIDPAEISIVLKEILDSPTEMKNKNENSTKI